MDSQIIRFRQKYSPGTHLYKGDIFEIRWDVMGCNLQCQFCWSPASITNSPEKTIDKKPEDILSDTILALKKPERTFVRFTGGEPMLYWEQLYKVLQLFEKNEKLSNIPILIQTNGIEIGNGNSKLDFFLNTKLNCIFELSFKGTNSNEFSLLAQKSPHIYKFQIEAFKKLKEISSINNNINVIAVLGIYHSSINKAKFVFVDPRSKELLFEDEERWDNDFKSIWISALWKWVEPLRMSPLGVWKNTWKQCGEEGSKMMIKSNNQIDVNLDGYFISKPQSYKYANQLIMKAFNSN